MASGRPERGHPADDAADRCRPKIPPVERCRYVGDQHEDGTGTERSAAGPGNKSASTPVAFERISDMVTVDRDPTIALANGLTGDGGDALEQRYAKRQIIAIREQKRAAPVRPEQHIIADPQVIAARSGQDAPEADRCAGGGVPDDQRSRMQRGCHHQDQAGDNAEQEFAHRVMAKRHDMPIQQQRSQARCWSS